MKMDGMCVENPLIWPETMEARIYQQNIARKACQKNTMVILPTALGKTVISCLAATHFLYNYWDKKILVMAPTRPLVLQHKDTFSNLLKIKAKHITVLTGKTSPRLRKHIWERDYKVFFATPQVVKNDLENNRLSLKNFSFVVFDECHRARKNYAYTFVAKKYVEQAPWPIILATTASPGSKSDVIRQTCEDLFIEQVEHRTEESTDVAPYIHRVDVEWRQIFLPDEYKILGRTLNNILLDRLKKLQAMGVIKSIRYATRRNLLDAGENLRKRINDASEAEKGPLYGAIILQAASLTTFHAIELLETQGIYSLNLFLDRVEKQSHKKKSYRNIVLDPDYHILKNYLIKYGNLTHPKIHVLKEEVRRQLSNNLSTRILVFTQYRDTASHILKELKDIDGIRVKRFVGQASKENDPGLTQDEQTNILNDFKKGDLNVLVATSIAEEGLDVPAVDLVIFYEPIPSEIRYIQRKGRTGRKNIGKTVILAAKDTSDIAYLYASKRRVEKMKAITSNLNDQLKSITRKGKLVPETIPKSEIAEEKLFTPSPKIVEGIGDFKEFIKEVNRATKILWTKIMKAGVRGLLIEDIMEELVFEGYSPSIIEAAIDDLEKHSQIYKLDLDRVASVASTAIERKEDKDIHIVEIERVLPGRAICIINDKWRARLASEEYEGPPNLIKKNTRFKAKSNLYHDGKTLCIHVKRVVEIL